MMDDDFRMGGQIMLVECTGNSLALTENGDFSAVGLMGEILFTVVLVSGIENLKINS